MKRTIPLLMALLIVSQAYCKDKPTAKKKSRNFFSELFTPRSKPEPIVQKKRKRITRKKKSNSKTTNKVVSGFFVVDAQWMANYLEQEIAWDYPIPEDDQIIFSDGMYHVPPVVYRHYEDMRNTYNPNR